MLRSFPTARLALRQGDGMDLRTATRSVALIGLAACLWAAGAQEGSPTRHSGAASAGTRRAPLIVESRSDTTSDRQKSYCYALVGAVKLPEAYLSPLKPLTVQELVTGAGGLTEEASGLVRIFHQGQLRQQFAYSPERPVVIQPGSIVVMDALPAGFAANTLEAAGDSPLAETAAGQPAELINIACLGLDDRPVVLRIEPQHATLRWLLPTVGLPVEEASTLRMIAPPGYRSLEGRLLSGTVLVFDEARLKSLSATTRWPLPPATPLGSPPSSPDDSVAVTHGADTPVDSAQTVTGPGAATANTDPGESLPLPQLLPQHHGGDESPAHGESSPSSRGCAIEAVERAASIAVPERNLVVPPQYPASRQPEPPPPAVVDAHRPPADQAPAAALTTVTSAEAPFPAEAGDGAAFELASAILPHRAPDPLHVPPPPLEVESAAPPGLPIDTTTLEVLNGAPGDARPAPRLVAGHEASDGSSLGDIALGLGLFAAFSLALSAVWARRDRKRANEMAKVITDQAEAAQVPVRPARHPLELLISNALPLVDEEPVFPPGLAFHGRTVGFRHLIVSGPHAAGGPHFSLAGQRSVAAAVAETAPAGGALAGGSASIGRQEHRADKPAAGAGTDAVAPCGEPSHRTRTSVPTEAGAIERALRAVSRRSQT